MNNLKMIYRSTVNNELEANYLMICSTTEYNELEATY